MNRVIISKNNLPERLYKNRWHCQKCGAKSHVGELIKKERSFCGVKLFDIVCPICGSNDLKLMNLD